jgi:hypothetical protein
MKTATLLLLLFLGGGLARASDQRSSFLITTKAEDKSATRGQTSALASWLESMVIKSIMKEFPCAEITTQSTIGAVLDWQRQRDLLGGNVDEDLKSLASAIGLYDYLISLTVIPLGGRTVLHASCISLKTSKPVAMDTTVSGEGPDAAVDACEDFARQFVRKMAYLEICPYKGPVHVTVQSKRNKEEKEEYPVYCNKSDEMYKKNTKITKTTDTDWSLQKTGRRSASGTVTHQNYECTEVVEENGCYRCPSGRQGGRTFTQKSTATTAIDGLSEESRREGKAQKDARITLVFNEDDTFTVEISATSRDGTRQERIEEKAEGICDTKTAPPKVVEGKVNVPLPGKWGPFAGSPVDKVLRGRTNETKVDPLTEEETTTGIEFELQRN